MIKIKRAVICFLALILSVFVGCGENQRPVVDNPGQAIFSQIFPPLSARAGEVLVLEVTATDPDDDNLSYEWTAKNGSNADVTNTVFVAAETPAQADEGDGEVVETEQQLAANQGPKVQFTAAEGGIYLVTVTIDDGNENKVNESTFIEVTAVNRPPALDTTNPITVSPGPPHSIGRDIFLTAQAADPDGDLLTYAWTVKDQENQDVLDVLETTVGTSVKFMSETAGSFLVSVVVTDDNDGQDCAAVVVVVDGQTQGQ